MLSVQSISRTQAFCHRTVLWHLCPHRASKRQGAVPCASTATPFRTTQWFCKLRHPLCEKESRPEHCKGTWCKGRLRDSSLEHNRPGKMVQLCQQCVQPESRTIARDTWQQTKRSTSAFLPSRLLWLQLSNRYRIGIPLKHKLGLASTQSSPACKQGGYQAKSMSATRI